MVTIEGDFMIVALDGERLLEDPNKAGDGSVLT
jgi:hypothetical protein